MLLYWFFVLHQPCGMRRSSGGSWKCRCAGSLFIGSPGCQSDEIFKGVNPVMKLLERLRAATALVQSVTDLRQEKDQ